MQGQCWKLTELSEQNTRGENAIGPSHAPMQVIADNRSDTSVLYKCQAESHRKQPMLTEGQPPIEARTLLYGMRNAQY
jgi:hypothetical protein